MTDGERTQRGFRVFGRVKDSKGETWRVQESSAAFEGAHAWLFWDSGKDARDVIRPHLSVSQAKELVALLGMFIQEAERGALMEPADGDGEG